MLQKADASKSRCLERPVLRKGRFQPAPPGPSRPLGSYGPYSLISGCFPAIRSLFGACHTALPFLAEQPVEPAPVLHLLPRDGNAKRLPGRLVPALPQKPARTPRDHKRALDRVSDVHVSEVTRPLGTGHLFPARLFSSDLDQLIPRVLGGLEGRPERVEAPPPLEKLAAGEHLLDRLGEKVGLPRQLLFSSPPEEVLGPVFSALERLRRRTFDLWPVDFRPTGLLWRPAVERAVSVGGALRSSLLRLFGLFATEEVVREDAGRGGCSDEKQHGCQ
jgi:hypothetical protein